MMADGGKTENTALNQLTEELEYYLQLTFQTVEELEKIVSYGREVCLSACRTTCKTKPNFSLNESLKSSNAPTELLSNDEDSLLEDGIKRILKVAEQVRGKSVKQEGCRADLTHMPLSESKSVKNKKNDGLLPSEIKDSAKSYRNASTSSKTAKKPMITNTLKTTYQKDFSLAKAKSLPSLPRLSKSTESPFCDVLERKSLGHQDKNMGTASTTSYGSSEAQMTSKKKDFIKINVQNIGMTSKKSSKNVLRSKRKPEFASVPSVSRQFEEARFSEEVAAKSLSPNCKEVLAAVRDVHSFINDSKSKKSSRELKLQESFMNKCSTSGRQYETEPELRVILKSLLPHCGWVQSESNLNDTEDVINKAKDKLGSILKEAQIDQSNAISGCSQVDEDGSNSVTQKDYKSGEFISQDSSVISSALQGMKVPWCVYYGDVSEWLSFQNTVCEIHEYHIHQRILKLIHPIISEYLNSKVVENRDSAYNDEKWKESLALLVKTAITIADFPGHLTVPILAGIKSIAESLPMSHS